MNLVVERLPLKKEIVIGSVGVNETVGLECLFSKSNRGLYDISVGPSEIKAYEFSKNVRAFISNYPVVYKKLAEQVMDILMHRLTLLEKAVDIYLESQTKELPNYVDKYLLDMIKTESFKKKYLFEKKTDSGEMRVPVVVAERNNRSKFLNVSQDYLQKVEAQSEKMRDGEDYMHQEIQSMDTLQKQMVILQYSETRRKEREERLGKSPRLTGKESTTLVDNYFKLRKMIHKSTRSSSPPLSRPAQEQPPPSSRQPSNRIFSCKKSFKTSEPSSTNPRRQIRLSSGVFLKPSVSQYNMHALVSSRSTKKKLSRNSLFITKVAIQAEQGKAGHEGSDSIKQTMNERMGLSNVIQKSRSPNQSIKISQSYQMLEKEKSVKGAVVVKSTARPSTAAFPKRVGSARYLQFK
jgi:hypothetical protein